MLIMGIDPNPKLIGWILWDSKKEEVPRDSVTRCMGMEEVDVFLNMLFRRQTKTVVIETPVIYQKAKKEVGDTLRVVGMIEWELKRQKRFCKRLTPQKIRGHVTRGGGGMTVRQCLIARFGKDTKGEPLEGITYHIWSALAAAVWGSDCLGDAWTKHKE